MRAVSLGLVFSKGPSFKVSEDFQLNSDSQRGVNGPLVSVEGTFGGGFLVGQHGQLNVAYVWRQEVVVSLGGRF